MPDAVPIEIQRRNNAPPVIWEFLDDGQEAPLDLAGSAFDLTVRWIEGEIVHATGAGALIVDPTLGRVTWAYTLEESERLPRGSSARYELRRLLAGEVETWAGGPVAVDGWLPR